MIALTITPQNSELGDRIWSVISDGKIISEKNVYLVAYGIATRTQRETGISAAVVTDNAAQRLKCNV